MPENKKTDYYNHKTLSDIMLKPKTSVHFLVNFESFCRYCSFL